MTKSLRTGEDKTMKRKILNIIKIVVLLSVFLGTLNISSTTFATDANQTLEDGVYTIKSALNNRHETLQNIPPAQRTAKLFVLVFVI